MYLRPVGSWGFLAGLAGTGDCLLSGEVGGNYFLDRLEKLRLKLSSSWNIFTEV